MFKYYKNRYGEDVPRVNEVLRHIGDSSSLCKWANYLGLFKRQKYDAVLSEYSSVGEYAHNMINDYINNQENNYEISNNLYSMASNAYSGFKKWYDDISKNNIVNVVFSEYMIVGDKYGGTIDLLIEINGLIYLVDFKTSSSIKINHILQLCAYKSLLKEVENIEISGMLILKSDKNNPDCYTEYMILNDDNNQDFIQACTDCFNDALSFYNNYKLCTNIFNEKGQFMIK